MKVAQITQLLLTLVGTLIAVEAYDAPYSYGSIGYTNPDNVNKVGLYFYFPKANFSEINIYNLGYHLKIDSAGGVYGPKEMSAPQPSWDNADEDVYTPWITAKNLEAVGDKEYYLIYVSLLAEQQPLCIYNDLKFQIVLHGSEGEQLFPITISVQSIGMPSISSCSITNPLTAT